MIGGCAVKYQSTSARIDTCDRLMSRLLSWNTYLPQYGSAAPPRPPPAAPEHRRTSAPSTWHLEHLRTDGALLIQSLVEPVHVAIASVGIGDRRDRDDDVVANLLDERRRLGREAVGQLHQHFGRAGLAAVQAAHEVIVRLRRRDELLDLVLAQAARIGDLREVVAVLLQVLDVVVRRDPDDDELASFVGLADRLDLHARRGRGQRAVVLQDVGVVGQLVRRADVIAEHVFRRRNPLDDRQVIDQRADEVRLGRPLLHRLFEVRVLRLRGIAGFGDHLLRGQRHDREQQRGADQELPHRGLLRREDARMISLTRRADGEG